MDSVSSVFNRPAIDLAHLPQDDAVYRMLQEADTIGIFQVETEKGLCAWQVSPGVCRNASAWNEPVREWLKSLPKRECKAIYV